MNPNRSFILCATDFSPESGAAAGVAAKLALRRSERLRLVHAPDAADAAATARARERLQTEGDRLRELGCGAETLLLESGRPVDALLEFIRNNPPALVVLGSGVKGRVDRWIGGSFSERIAESSPVPTLIVRDTAAFESWDWTKNRLTVLLALDLHASSDVVLRWARAFQTAGPCDLVACHVNWRLPTLDESVPNQPVNPPELQSRLERELRKKIRDQIGDDVNGLLVKPFFGEPAECVVATAKELNAQLVAVGTHQRHGLGRLLHVSVSRELLREARTNVVCVPLHAKFDAREAHIPDYRRVLVATDFSEAGNAAVPFACAACAPGGLVKLVHVVSPLDSVTTAGGDATEPLLNRLREVVPHELGARAQPPEFAVLKARDVAGEICAEAERFGADLVCLASHGSGFSRAWHGSVASGVLNRIRRPLLVVRRPEE